VSQVVLLDTGPLGLVTNPRRSPQSVACAQWLQALVTRGIRVIVPEIADYEVPPGVAARQEREGTGPSRRPRQSVGVFADYHGSNTAGGSVLGAGPAAGATDRR